MIDAGTAYERDPRAAWLGAGFQRIFTMMGWEELQRSMPNAATAIATALHELRLAGRNVSLEYMAQHFPRAVLDHLSDGERARAAIKLPPLDGVPRVAELKARQWTQAIASELAAAKVHRAYNEAEIRDFAENYAHRCAMLTSTAARLAFVRSIGIEPPDQEKIAPKAIAVRLSDSHWWRRQLRKTWTREAENGLRAVGMICKQREPYASDAAVEHRAARIERTRQWAKERQMVSEEGTALDLLPIMDKSIANPALRRGEFMTRVRGFEEIAREVGHMGLFWTLTTPSRFHAQRSAGGINPSWEDERAKVRDAQLWLRTQWARARAKLARRGIRFYGFRIAEPHHDGTPHWHMVLFAEPAAVEALQKVLRDCWLPVNSAESFEEGAQRYRIQCIEIDPTKGSAAGYVAKYVSKNIDGKTNSGGDSLNGEVSDEADLAAGENARRVAAWASAHGIRQFQQVGGPPVGLWRELRRLRDPLNAALIESVRTEADTGNWREFIKALGGIERASRRTRTVRTTFRRTMRVPRVDCYRLAARQWSTKCGPRVVRARRDARPDEMPAVWLDHGEPKRTDPQGREGLAITRYGEMPEARPVAICSYTLGGDRYEAAETRATRWRVEKKCSQSQSPGDSADGPSLNSAMDTLHKSAGGGVVLFGSISGARSASDSDLGPVAISVLATSSQAERATEIARIIAAVESRPGWRPFDPGGYQWPADIPEFKRQRRH